MTHHSYRRQVFAGSGVVGRNIVLIDSIQVSEQKIKDFRIVGHGIL